MLAALPPRSFRFERIPDNLLRDPLDFLKADHVRMRRVCDGLEKLAAATEQNFTNDMIEALVTYLSDGFLRHMEDEEVDLFPKLRTKCKPEDQIDDLLDGLCHDHNVYQPLADGIVRGLRQLMIEDDQANKANLNRLIACFAATEQRHLKLEDNIVLPLAKRRLSPSDIEEIGRSMAVRRNIAYPD